jgi:hypothetical protein
MATLTVKSFCVIQNYANNANKTLSPVGELSNYSTTFSKDIKRYQNATNNNLTLNVFSAKESTLGQIPLNQEIRDIIETVCSWVYTTREGATGNITRAVFLSALKEQFVTAATDINCGEIIRSNAGKYYPEWISFSKRNYAAGGNVLKVWFADSSFQTLYDEYEITVVPPLARIDDFFLAPNIVFTKLLNVNIKETVDRLEVARNKDPETNLCNVAYEYVSPLDTTKTAPTYWSVLIYGPMGNDDDVISNAIIDYIAAHSTRGPEQWKPLIPELFKRTEFTIYPRWHLYSIPNKIVDNSGIYLNTINPIKEIAWVKNIIPGVAATFIDQHIRFMPHHFKSLMLTVLPGDSNRNNLFDIDVIYPDVINVASTSNDFNRMSARTQEWLRLLAQAIVLAETINSFTDTPSGYRKISRSGITYISFVHENVRFLVSAKSSTPGY